MSVSETLFPRDKDAFLGGCTKLVCSTVADATALLSPLLDVLRHHWHGFVLWLLLSLDSSICASYSDIHY